MLNKKIEKAHSKKKLKSFFTCRDLIFDLAIKIIFFTFEIRMRESIVNIKVKKLDPIFI